MARFVQHAESLQIGVSGRGARDAPLCVRMHRFIPWSPWLAGFWPAIRNAQDFGETYAAKKETTQRRLCPTIHPISRWGPGLRRFARQRDSLTEQVALAWVLQQRGRDAPIVGGPARQHDETLDDARPLSRWETGPPRI